MIQLFSGCAQNKSTMHEKRGNICFEIYVLYENMFVRKRLLWFNQIKSCLCTVFMVVTLNLHLTSAKARMRCCRRWRQPIPSVVASKFTLRELTCRTLGKSCFFKSAFDFIFVFYCLGRDPNEWGFQALFCWCLCRCVRTTRICVRYLGLRLPNPPKMLWPRWLRRRPP